MKDSVDESLMILDDNQIANYAAVKLVVAAIVTLKAEDITYCLSTMNVSNNDQKLQEMVLYKIAAYAGFLESVTELPMCSFSHSVNLLDAFTTMSNYKKQT